MGVVCDVPTIGVGKTFLMVEELTEKGVKQAFAEGYARDPQPQFAMMLVGGESGFAYGAALKSTAESLNPVYVSPGHRITPRTAVEIVRRVCRHRVPEPVRQADLTTRAVVAEFLKSSSSQ